MIRPAGLRPFLAILIALGAPPALAAVAPDAEWPVKPVRLIVPFPPGGAVDPLARLISARLPAALGQQFVVDILDKFHGELVKLFNQPDVRNQLGDQLGMDIVASSPAAL